MARLTSSGVLDTDFDSDGKQTIDFGGIEEICYGVAVDSQDRMLVAGTSDQATTRSNDFALDDCFVSCSVVIPARRASEWIRNL